jgi:hypothetical protein
MKHRILDEIDEKINRLYKDSVLKKYDINWTKEQLIDSLIQTEIQLHEKDKLLEKFKLDLMKFKQILIEKESEISEKKITINNLKNQINIFKEEKTVYDYNQQKIQSKSLYNDHLNHSLHFPQTTNQPLPENDEKHSQKTEISRNYDDISFDGKNNSILKIIKEKYRKNIKSGHSVNEPISNSQNVQMLSNTLNKLNVDYDNLKTKYNNTLDELIDKTKIIESLYSEISYLKTNILDNTNKLDSSIPFTTFSIYLKEGLTEIKDDLVTFLKSWDIIIDINSISFSDNYKNENQVMMLLKEVRLLVVNLKRLKIEFKSKVKEFYNNAQSLTSNYFTFFQEKLDVLNNKLNHAQSRLTYIK